MSTPREQKERTLLYVLICSLKFFPTKKVLQMSSSLSSSHFLTKQKRKNTRLASHPANISSAPPVVGQEMEGLLFPWRNTLKIQDSASTNLSFLQASALPHTWNILR